LITQTQHLGINPDALASKFHVIDLYDNLSRTAFYRKVAVSTSWQLCREMTLLKGRRGGVSAGTPPRLVRLTVQVKKTLI
jgi:hypothetical protein